MLSFILSITANIGMAHHKIKLMEEACLKSMALLLQQHIIAKGDFLKYSIGSDFKDHF